MWRGGVAVMVVTITLGAASPLATGAQAPLAVGDRPNILVIVTDDQRATEGTWGVLPATRRWLRKKGTRYPRAFATTPLCCPSRVSIFTGKYAHNHGVFSNQGKPKFNHDFTIQGYLDDRGYRTGMIGKFFNDWPMRKRPPHFDKWAMFDGGYKYRTWNVGGKLREVKAYSTRFITRKTIDFMHAFENRDANPWMMYVAPYAPHAPFIPMDGDKGSKVPPWNGNPAVFEKKRGDKPEYVRIRDEQYRTWKKNRRKQLRVLKSVDDLVRRVKKGLRNLEEASDTIVFFMSDNGYMWADHGLYDKGAPYTPSIQIPMVMHVPGKAGGRTDRRLVGNIDVAPTILDAAGIPTKPGHRMDGRSLLDKSWDRDRILAEYRNYGNIWTPSTWASIRTRSFQYVEYYENGDRIFREYYNLKKDPWQLRNLLRDGTESNDPSRTRLRSLARRLRADRKCSGAACP